MSRPSPSDAALLQEVARFGRPAVFGQIGRSGHRHLPHVGAKADRRHVALDYPAHSPAGLAAALPVVGSTAITALRDMGRLQPGQRLLVRGASGGVGSIAVQLGRALGAHVTGLASAANLSFVRELGAPTSRSTMPRPRPPASIPST